MQVSRAVRVAVPGGIHARPAADIVKLSKAYQSDLVLEYQGKTATTRSSFKLILLSLKEGEEVVIRGEGVDADRAVADMAAYLAARTGDADDGTDHGAVAEAKTQAQVHAQAQAQAQAQAKIQAAPAEAAQHGSPETHAPDQDTPDAATTGTGPGEGGTPDREHAALAGTGNGCGSAIGPVVQVRQPEIDPFPPQADDPAHEAQRAREALAAIGRDLRQRAAETRSASTAEVFAALAELAEDQDWIARIDAAIAAGASAGRAVLDSGTAMAAMLAQLEDPYARARSEDIASLTRRVALHLQGKQPMNLGSVAPGSLVLAEEISAAEAGGDGLGRLGGLVTLTGSAASHAAILARAAGLPAVFGVADPGRRLETATILALDSRTGEVFADPDAATSSRITDAISRDRADQAQLQALVDVRPRTGDGRAITVAANLGSVEEIDRARAAGAMGVGLFRTEFLFLNRNSLPGEEEQFAVYRRLLEAFPQDPVVIRTLDIGADKPVRGLALAREDNPFLGLRGIRLCLKYPDLLRPQLRALLRAAAFGPLHVMLPMVSHVGEIDATRAILETCRRDLLAEDREIGEIALGIMVETPAAVLAAAELAREVAFFSIGTNDLTQYIMAADRLNPSVADLCRVDRPAIMAAVRLVCEAARAAGIWVGLCGEAAADPGLTRDFIAAGVTELSMAPSAILKVKRAVQQA